MTAPTIIGLDLSLTATGIDYGYGAKVMHTKLSGVHRLAWYRDQLIGIVQQVNSDLVIVEDYAYRAMGAHSHQTGELGGVARLCLHDLGIPVVEMNPSALKRFATGKGNANKVAMGMAASKARYDGPEDDNAIDAWWLRRMGLYRYCSTRRTTAYRDDVVSKITWPTLDGVA